MNSHYATFGGSMYYAKGGWHDYLGWACTVAAACKIALEAHPEKIEWWHVVDMRTGNIVAGSRSQAHGADDLPASLPATISGE